MSAAELEEFYVHTVSVEMHLGTNGYGEDTFAPAVTVRGMVDETRKLVRSTQGDRTDGEAVVSESTFYTWPLYDSLFSPSSRVTYRGMVARVIKASLNDMGDSLDLPDHLAVSLT